jgi:hypothetical protein
MFGQALLPNFTNTTPKRKLFVCGDEEEDKVGQISNFRL